MTRPHLAIRDTPIADDSINQPLPDIEETKIIYNSTELLWVVSTWLIVVSNICSCAIGIRDMYINTYQPAYHWLMSAIFLFTIGGIVTINKYIIK